MKKTTNPIPYEASHPGYLLKDELDARNIQQSDFAVEIGMQKTMLNEIIKGKRPITSDIAILLETVLQIPADYWMRFQSQYEIDLARIKEKNIQKVENIKSWAIIKELVPVAYFKKIGYLVNDLTIDIAKIMEVYAINSITELAVQYENKKFAFHRKSDKLTVNMKNVWAWNMVAEYEAKTQKVNEFEVDNLSGLYKDLHAVFYENSSTVEQVKDTLNNYGIKFVVVNKLEQTPIDGYTFWSGDNPAIALTLRHQRIDNFAFTLMHEIGHIICHLVQDKNLHFFDSTDNISLVPQLEDEADHFAQNTLVSPQVWSEITELPQFDDENINNIATKHHIHSAIILGQINYKFNSYNIANEIDKKLY
jgi:HTH-type transcriptional regulator/antitoxin HigA